MNDDQKKSWIQTKDGSWTMRSEQYQECYHSQGGAWSETEYVFIVPWRESVHYNGSHWKVLDVGFGLGYNCLAVLHEWVGQSRRPALQLVSLEQDESLLTLDTPLNRDTMPWIRDEAWTLWLALKQTGHVQTQEAELQMKLGPAPTALQDILSTTQRFNWILQDPFSPQKNPECWSESFLQTLGDLSDVDGALMTYSVAGVVRRGLMAAGFSVVKRPGIHFKRSVLAAQKRTRDEETKKI